MARRALLVGIENYDNFASLPGCTDDARAIQQLLNRHANGELNYECRLFADLTDDREPITRKRLRKAIRELFKDYRGDVLLYFSGHGTLSEEVGYLVTSDGDVDDYGISMDEILTMASASEAQDILLLIDSCNSGSLGNPASLNINKKVFPIASLRENMTIIAASRDVQTAAMYRGKSVFTDAVVGALEGGAADHLGYVTAPSIYIYAERRFGEFDQRPVYKSHATQVSVIRKCAPLIERYEMQELVRLFPTPDYKYPLDPEYEPEDEYGNIYGPTNDEKIRIAHLLKEYRDAGLLKASIPGEQLYWAARHSHSVELTVRGQEYWHLVKENRL